MNRQRWKPATIAMLVAYSGTIAAANWASTVCPAIVIVHLYVPAGAFFAGLAFTLRAGVQEGLGARTALVAVAGGAALSWLVASPRMAIASAVAFALSELSALVLYGVLRRRGRLVAVGASGAVGLLVDSLVFVPLAFGSLTYLAGQIAGKTATTVLAIAVLAAVRAHRRRRPA